MFQVRSWLSEQIAPLHAEVDRRAGGFDISTEAGADALTRFLAVGVHDVEAGLDTAGAAAVLPEYESRARRHLLPAPAGGHPVVLSSVAAVWGALYVLEGSRLGGRWLAKQSSHLRKHPFFAKDEPVFWPIFLSRLEAACAGDALDRGDLLAGARAAFEAFLRVDPSQLETLAFANSGRVAGVRELCA